MAIKLEIVILCLFLVKSTVQCWSSNEHNVRHHHHRNRNTNNIVNKQLTNVSKQQVNDVFTTTETTTTTKNVNNQLITNVNKQQQKIFPCDNFICLLETFELLKTESGFLLNKLPTSSENPVNSGSRCTDFKCWFKKFKVEPKSYGFEFSLQKFRTATKISPTTSTTSKPITTIHPSNSISLKNSYDQFLNDKDDQYYDLYDLLE